MKTVHIIGAGIAGLGAAHFLAAQGIQSVVYEAADHIGGRAAGSIEEGTLFEVGGKNFSSQWPRFNALLKEFDIHEHDAQHPDFHIVLKDKLVKLDKRRTLSGDLHLAMQLGLRGSLQLRDFLGYSRKHADELNYTRGLIQQVEQKWDYQSVASHFAPSLVAGPMRMFSIIMGAAEPDEVYPSLLTLFTAGFSKGQHFAIQGGIQRFHQGLANNKNIRLGERVERIDIEQGKVSGLVVNGADGEKRIAADAVISAVPAHVFKRLLVLPDQAQTAVEQIRYFPLVMINARYDRPVFRDGVNSIMFEPGSVLGHCSANRLYQPELVRFTLSGAAARKVLHHPDETLIALAETEFSRRMPITGQLVTARVTRHMGGICAYAPNFTRVKAALLAGVERIAGLAIAGDYLEGHTMEGCLHSAELASQRIGRYLAG
ncbi:protoporphyrinogen/coproporphyrinogen oxidase [Raoultella ornithinolytica]|uniref:protoporphyrinogen/coproporphyrinogen oxidase n=1 Tax=Raoultella ornithinolytica TaxID=54291 RepID=UPI00384B5BB5